LKRIREYLTESSRHVFWLAPLIPFLVWYLLGWPIMPIWEEKYTTVCVPETGFCGTLAEDRLVNWPYLLFLMLEVPAIVFVAHRLWKKFRGVSGRSPTDLPAISR